MQHTAVYEVMQGEQLVCSISAQGKCRIYQEALMPYQLWLEESDDLDTRVNNITGFYYWCSARVLTLDRKYAKQILNSICASQAASDKDRAQVALSYHCMSLTDIYWVREEGEKVTYHQINLYDNHLQNAFVDIALRGKQMTVQNAHLIADDVATQGLFPKAWIREEQGFSLLKDGGIKFVENEILASKVCRCFDCHQVIYEPYEWEGVKVSKSRLITGKKYSISTMEAFEIYAQNQGISSMEYILGLDAYSYYMMNVLDYLVGNTDRHWGNWGLLIDNETNTPVRLYDLMDLNQAFQAYDTMEGANCQTRRGAHLSQQEAARDAVRSIGWHQIKDIEEEWFEGRDRDYGMLLRRRQYLMSQV